MNTNKKKGGSETEHGGDFGGGIGFVPHRSEARDLDAGAGLVDGGFDFLEAVALETALLPIATDEGVDVKLFEGRLGVELVIVVDGETLPGGGVFAGDDDGLGVEAMFERVEAGTGGFLRVGAVGGELCGSGTGESFKKNSGMRIPATRGVGAQGR